MASSILVELWGCGILVVLLEYINKRKYNQTLYNFTIAIVKGPCSCHLQLLPDDG